MMMDIIKENSYSTKNANSHRTNEGEALYKIEDSSPKKVIGNNSIIELKSTKIHLERELGDAGNILVAEEIENLLSVNEELINTQENFFMVSQMKSFNEDMISKFKEKDEEVDKILNKYSYNYTTSYEGLKKIIEEFHLKNQMAKTFTKLDTSNNSSGLSTPQGGSPKKSATGSIQRRSTNGILSMSQGSTGFNNKYNYFNGNSALEKIYVNLGHEMYTKIIRIFEKYCLFGKTNTSFNMDYSQFSTFMSQNLIYDDFLTKSATDLIFNKVKNFNKSITFEDFVIILIEFAKLVFSWEKNTNTILNYFVNRYFINIPCLSRTEEDNNLERWFTFLETDEFSSEIKKHLPRFYKMFLKYKVKDLKVAECIQAKEFLKFTKDINVIPIFLTSKDVINIVNSVKYRKKALVPKDTFDFCTYMEAISLIALQSFEKYEIDESQTRSTNHVEKLKLFIKYINDQKV